MCKAISLLHHPLVILSKEVLEAFFTVAREKPARGTEKQSKKMKNGAHLAYTCGASSPNKACYTKQVFNKHLSNK